MFRKVISLILIAIFAIILAAYKTADDNNLSRNNKKTSTYGTVILNYQTVPECGTDLHLDITSVLVASMFYYTSTRIISPAHGGTDNLTGIPTNTLLTLSIDPNNFVCNGTKYGYEMPAKNTFILSQVNPSRTFNIKAVKITDEE